MSGAEDTTHLPAALQKFFQVVLGLEWPEAGEGGLRDLRHAWWDAASAVEDFADLVGADAVVLTEALHGALGDQVVGYLRTDLADGVTELVAGMRELSRAAGTAAADVQKAKIMLIAMAALALATVISLLYSLIFSFMIPAVEAAAQVGLRLVLRELAAKIASLSVREVGAAAVKLGVDAAKFGAFGGAFMGGLDGGIQLGQIAAGGRESFDWESLKGSVIGGVVGGAVGGVAHGLSRGVVSGLSAEVRGRVSGSVRALGHFGYASAQVAAAGVSNPLINVATGMRGNVWDGIIGAASRGHAAGRTGADGPETGTFAVPALELDLLRDGDLPLEQEVLAAAGFVGAEPAAALTSAYQVESAGGAVFATARPSDVPARPEIRVARDGTLAINGWKPVAGTGPVTEAREFFAAPEVLAAAQKTLRRLGSRVSLAVDDTRIVLGDGTRQVLHRVVPRTGELTTDSSSHVAGVVQNGRPDTLVLGSGDQTAFVPMSVDGSEVTGARHLAEGLVETATHGEPAALTPGRAAEFARRDQPGTPGSLPGRSYGELVANRALLDEVSQNAGVNQHAWAKPGQMYVAVPIPEGRPVLAADQATGHHFATVIAESADGRSQITLENYSRSGETHEIVRAAVEAELRRGSGDPALAAALEGVRKTGFDGADPIARARAGQAMATHLGLVPGPEQWHFRMYTKDSGETFFDQHAQGRTIAPLFVVAAGGLSGFSPVTVGFDQGQRTAPADALVGVRSTARDVARAAVARADLGLPLPQVTVSGFSAGRAGFADAVARGRAEQVLATFQEAVAGELHRLQGNEKTVEEIAAHVELGRGHDRMATLRVSFDEPAARDPRHEAALAYDRVAHGLPELVLPPQELRSRMAEFDALADDFVHHAPSAGTRDRLTGVDRALAAVTDPALKAGVRTFVNDALLASSLTPVRETSLHLVPANRIDQLLDDLTAELAHGRDPFARRSSPLHGLAAPENAPLPVRLATLALTNLSPPAREAVAAGPLFTALTARPEALVESLFAATGFEEQYFITTCVPAAVNSAVRAKVPTLASLLHVGRSVADTTERQITRASPEARQKADRPFGRSQETMARKRIADARTEFTAVEDRALRLSQGEQTRAVRQEWRQLTVRWSRTMQKLAAAQLDLPVVPVLTRKVIRGDWTASVAVMSSVFLDRPTRRRTGVDHQNYLGLLQSELAIEPGGGLFGADEVSSERSPAVPLADELTTPQDVDRFWDRVAGRGGTVLSTPDHAVHLGAGTVGGKRVFALNDPMYARPVVLTPDALTAWAAKEDAAAGPALFGGSPATGGATADTAAFLTGGPPARATGTTRESQVPQPVPAGPDAPVARDVPADPVAARAWLEEQARVAEAKLGKLDRAAEERLMAEAVPIVTRWYQPPLALGLPVTRSDRPEQRRFVDAVEAVVAQSFRHRGRVAAVALAERLAAVLGAAPPSTPVGGARGRTTPSTASLLAPPVPDDVATWRPDPGGNGPRTLRAYLDQVDRPGVISTEVGERGAVSPETSIWVTAWVDGMRLAVDVNGSPHTPATAARLSGGLTNAHVVASRWRRTANASLSAPPEEVVAWRPSTSGPGTLREVLEQRDLPPGSTLTRTGAGELHRAVQAWVWAWADRWTNTGGAGPAVEPETVAAASGGLLSVDQVRDRYGALPPREVVEWRPAADGPRTLREVLEQRDLPPGISLERNRRGALNQATTSWIRAWVQGIGDHLVDGRTMSRSDVAELSGGLVNPVTVSQWLRHEQPPAPPRAFLTWAPAPDGTWPRTLPEFLAEYPLPPGITLARRPGGTLGTGITSWIKEWTLSRLRERAEATGFEGALAEVTALVGGLVSRDTLGDWVRDPRSAALPSLPQDLASWLPADQSGPRTLRERLDQLGLPVYPHWVREWARGMRGRIGDSAEPLTPAEVAGMSGIASAAEVRRWWPRSSAGPVVPDDVVTWRPEESGPRTLREYLRQRDLPENMSFDVGGATRLSNNALRWLKAWVQNVQSTGVHGEHLTADAVATLSGDLVVASTVRWWWPKQDVIEPPAHVVRWRPAPDGTGSRTLADHLAGVELPLGISFERTSGSGGGSQRMPGGATEWLRRWAAGMFLETDENGRALEPMAVVELSGGLISRTVAYRWWRQEAETTDKRHLPDDPPTRKRRATITTGMAEVRLDQGRHEMRWESGPGDDDVRIVRAIRHDLVPDAAMDHAFPWRDPENPVERVYAPFAAEDGSLHPAVREGADRITARMSGGKALLKAIAAAPGDGRLADAGQKEMERLWPLLEADVAREVRRLVLGSQPGWTAPARPVTLTPDLVRPHEQVLVGRWGLGLSTPDAPPADRPSVTNGRVLGLYLGAVLRGQEDRERWGAEHPQFPGYAMQAGSFTMTAEGAANFTAFANTGLLADSASPQYDHEAINAQFVQFVVTVPDGTGKPRKLPVVAMVLLDNAFDPVANPHGIITVDYGDDYLTLFEQPVKQEVTEDPPATPDAARAWLADQAGAARASLGKLGEAAYRRLMAEAVPIVSSRYAIPVDLGLPATRSDRPEERRLVDDVEVVVARAFRDGGHAEAVVLAERLAGVLGAAPPQSLLGAARDQTSVRTAARLAQSVPAHVAAWRPAPDGTGPRTLIEHIAQLDRPAGVSAERDRQGRVNAETRAWVRAWLEGLRHDVNGKPYSAAAAAALSGGLVNAKSVSHIWTTASKGNLLETPEEVLTWRPRADGSQTLRGFLDQLDLPRGVDLGRGSGGRLNHVVETWVHAWVDRLRDPGNGGGPAIDPERVAAASGGLVTAEQVREREAARRPVSQLLPPREVVTWRPSADGPQTLREVVERLDLPPGISLERDGTGKLNAATRSWVEAWVRGFGDRVVDGRLVTTGKIAELSGGLVVQNTVSRWLRAGQQTAAPRAVLDWTPAADGTGPRTLGQFLDNHPLPPGVTLVRKGNGGLPTTINSWVREWLLARVRERLASTGFDAALAEVTALVGGLVGKDTIDGWVADIRSSALPALPQDVVSWRPTGSSGPRTLLERLGGPVHAHWVRDWAKSMWDLLSDDTGLPLTAAEVARMSGGLANAEQVARWWPRVGPEVADAAVPPDDVLHWRPLEGGSGTLREYLRQRPLPARVSFETGTSRLSLAAEQWVRAWAQRLQGVRLHGEVLDAEAVARLSGDLVAARTVTSWWGRPVVAEPPAHVVAWRPGPDGPRNLAEHLAGLALPPGISFERRRATGNRAPTLAPEAMAWVERWAAGMSEEVNGDGRRHTARSVAELSGGLVAESTVVRWFRKTAEPKPMASRPATESVGPRPAKRYLPDDGSAAKRRATVEARLDQGRHEMRWESGPGDDEVRIVRAIRHDLVPDPAMDHAFPWRDPGSPVRRVYGPFAAADGSLHPAVRAGSDRITAHMTGGKALLKAIAADPADRRLPTVGPREMERLWPLLEADVVREVRRLVDGPQPGWRPPARPMILALEHVRPHEQALVGKWGLSLSTSDSVSADRPSVTNGRVLGLYLGAVLRSRAEEDRWGAEHVRFPSYAMQVGGAGVYTMTAEGAANFTAFANTGLLAGARSPQYDTEAINAQFVRFTVTLPDATGRMRKLPVAAMVLLDNAFDPVANRHGIVTVDYGDDYLVMFEGSVKQEVVD
ncbi:WXG100-like domain-containing protein [Lentzea cavernae]|uniref:Outer membrane channel protein CpnT-like N-terminal domain-containing protein n=1 Tax=Lentzea cavernae TaxID=2020703 RepID=A0ABQ3MSW6_9PSEU|nr:hypothetical protein [Lentzea cavernae]GHH56444.1 hypothetical protein GCM10017774_74500 [Lentzea cavernae]